MPKWFQNLNESQKMKVRWILVILTFIFIGVCLGLMIWGACILGYADAHDGSYNEYILGGLLTGICGFTFIFSLLNIFIYLSNRKEMFDKIKTTTKKILHIGEKENE